MTEQRTHRNIAGLDGIRALAVLVVLLSHLHIAVTWLDTQSWFDQFSRAGFLGVNMFFVLSGFLITYTLFSTQDASGRFAFQRFYISRIARILPAAMVFLVVHGVYAVMFDYPPFGRAKDELIMIAATVFQFANYAILENTELLEENGALWSLSVEGHFYIVWPCVMFVLFTFIKRKAVALGILVSLVPLLYVWMAWIFGNKGYLSAYLRTDARIVSLVVGAVAATLWLKTSVISTTFLRLVSVPALLTMAVIHSIGDGWEPFVWDGGMALFDISTAIVILALANGVFPLVEMLTLSVVEWIGKISYGLYIWQIPVLTIMNRHAPTWNQAVVAVLSVAIIVTLGGLSYYFVEQPIRHSRFVRQR